jgi:acyl dehydratase
MTFAYEDMEPGTVIDIGEYTFERDDILRFAQQFDPQPFHLDEAAGAASPFRGLVASGWHTCSAMMGLLVRHYLADSTSMGSPGVDEIRWVRPVRVGDTIRMRNKIVAKRVSESKPDRGIVSTEWECVNQHDEIVLIVRSKGIFGLRHPAQQSA